MPGARSHAYCWMEWILLAFGLPALILGLSRLVTLVIPAAQQGALEQRYLLSLVGPVIAEWLFVVAAWLFLRYRHESFREFGAWSIGTGRDGALHSCLRHLRLWAICDSSQEWASRSRT